MVHLHLFAIILSVFALGKAPDSAAILAAFGRADVYAEKAYDYYVSIHNFFVSERNAGKTDIEKEDWDRIVLPLAKKAMMNMDQAMAEVKSVLPDGKRKDFWKDVYNNVLSRWQYDTDAIRKMDFYQSEYIMRFAGYPDYIYMYLAILDNKFSSIENARTELKKIVKEL